MKKKILITTAIDYVNDVIHIGHAYQKILADCVARFERVRRGKDNVFFVTGTDEHGQKVYNAAKEQGLDVRGFVDDIAKKDQDQQDSLQISYDRFIRTTDEDHKKFAGEFFKKVYDAGYIYKGTYKGLYCEGCEAYKTEKDLVDGKCSLHPTGEIQVVEEENYFFKFSKFKNFLKDLYDSNPDFVLPKSRFKEMYSFIDKIEDIPVTRRKEKLPWGIECPIDGDHVIWVWFDALVNYLTFGLEKNIWNKNMEIIHFVGKDVARMHALLWPCMLKAAGYELPDCIYDHAFLSINGKKISKSLGNVIAPKDLVEKYGVDPVRYYFLRYGPIVEDADFSEEHFKIVYNADLANGLGNTVARLAKLAEKSELSFVGITNENDRLSKEVTQHFDVFRVDLAIQNVWSRLSELDKHINGNTPWAITDEKKLKEVLEYEIKELCVVASLCKPFIPDTSQKILNTFGSEKVTASVGLFPRI
ncbi:MAG: methionine--tRNA ligase [Patescibacteria group bacterium]